MTLAISVARETLASVSSSTGFTAANIPPTNNQTKYAVIQALGGNIRFTIDGTTPTTTLGKRLTNNSKIEIHGVRALGNFRCIDDGSTATVDCDFMGIGGPSG